MRKPRFVHTPESRSQATAASLGRLGVNEGQAPTQAEAGVQPAPVAQRGLARFATASTVTVRAEPASVAAKAEARRRARHARRVAHLRTHSAGNERGIDPVSSRLERARRFTAVRERLKPPPEPARPLGARDQIRAGVHTTSARDGRGRSDRTADTVQRRRVRVAATASAAPTGWRSHPFAAGSRLQQAVYYGNGRGHARGQEQGRGSGEWLHGDERSSTSSAGYRRSVPHGRARRRRRSPRWSPPRHPNLQHPVQGHGVPRRLPGGKTRLHRGDGRRDPIRRSRVTWTARGASSTTTASTAPTSRSATDARNLCERRSGVLPALGHRRGHSPYEGAHATSTVDTNPAVPTKQVAGSTTCPPRLDFGIPSTSGFPEWHP